MATAKSAAGSGLLRKPPPSRAPAEPKPPAGAVLRALRLRILEQVGDPGSAAEVARRLGEGRQKVAYHLRALEREGLVELVEERQRGNCRERIVRTTGRAYLVGADAIGMLAGDPDVAADKFSAAYLVSVAAQAVRDVAVLRQEAEAANKHLATLSLQTDVRFTSVAHRALFAEELVNAVAQLTAKFHDTRTPSGRAYRLFLGAYPAPRDKEKGPTHG